MPELLGICDRICVMNAGAFVGEFAGHEASQEKIMRAIMRNEAVINQQDDRLMRVGGV
jgi:putative multiple sugar transport system ATP-binding protein